MKAFKVIIACVFVLTFVSCSKERIKGNGPVITEQRAVGNFSRVEVSGSTNVYISRGSNFKVEVKGYSNILSHFETKLVGTNLILKFKDDVNINNDNTEVFITMPVLNGLKTAGSGSISTSGDFNGNAEFETTVEGSGNISIALGSTQLFRSTISGSGNISAFGMLADKAETNTAGSGNIEISVNNELKVRIVGSGNVYYKNTPLITANITGSGAVIPR
jgi:hypothetical protein